MSLFGSGRPAPLSARVENAAESAKRAAEEVESLREQLDHLTLITQALWELLKQKLEVSDQELMEMVRSVDQLDGKIDGRYSKVRANCPQCGRPVNASNNLCLYCNVKVEQTTPF
ncbi:MAG TPA: hypothetical protein VGP72_29655 [Planctomycetota bacterium]|jgi:hypothetical protein